MIGDGKMNNDQGFNGRKPLFDNEFNGPYGAANNFTGPGISGAPQYGPVGQPNNGYQPFTMGFNQPGQPASPYGNQYDQQPSDFSRSQTDLPPELGEIKNLNEAAVSSAPCPKTLLFRKTHWMPMSKTDLIIMLMPGIIIHRLICLTPILMEVCQITVHYLVTDMHQTLV